jgi:hypothetical protein
VSAEDAIMNSANEQGRNPSLPRSGGTARPSLISRNNLPLRIEIRAKFRL